jgi:hypothetical protein
MIEKPPSSSLEQPSLWHPLRIRNFRLLFIGESVSQLGDQFYLVALPWLTIQLTGSPLNLGGVLMAVAIPRAVLMVLGGALSDRFSPRAVMLTSNLIRVVLTGVLALLVFLQTIQLWQLYAFAITFGIVEGFFTPAAEAIVPALVPEDQLTPSNVLGQGAMQLIGLIGPAVAGVVIAVAGVGSAFAIDAMSFVVSTTALLLIRLHPSATTTAEFGLPEELASAPVAQGFLAGISEGLRYAWQHLPLRSVLLVLSVLNFLLIGPLQVGVATLAYDRFPGGAVDFGIMTSAWGAGGLLGTLLPQWLPRLPRLGSLMLGLAAIQGLGMVLLSTMPTVVLASLVIAVIGCCSSFFVLVGTIWLQSTTPPEMLGRIMGLGMLSSLGIAPFSYAFAGILAERGYTALFTGSGVAILLVVAVLSFKPAIRAIA